VIYFLHELQLIKGLVLMFHLVLHQPQIAPNTGNIIRLAANNGCWLHLIEPFGFDLEEKKLRRAGLDYHHMANVKTYSDYASFQQKLPELSPLESQATLYAVTTKGARHYCQPNYKPGDIFVFGSETHGLPDSVMNSIEPERRIKIPMVAESRSLNLSNAVAIVSYEALRQAEFGRTS